MMKLIDTHAHLDSVEDIDGAMDRAVRAGVSAVVAVGENLAANRKNLAIARRIERPRILVALGIHPSEAGHEDVAASLAFIEEHIQEACAVGEIGLDFWYQWARRDDAARNAQRDIYRRLLEVARQRDLPAVIHTRGAWREALETAKEMDVRKAVFHWYSGPLDVLDEILAAGYYVSASPSIAYSPESRRAIEAAPIERTLIETDSPVYYRCNGGFQAEPKEVFFTLRHYAILKQLPEAEAAEILNRNAGAVFQTAD